MNPMVSRWSPLKLAGAALAAAVCVMAPSAEGTSFKGRSMTMPELVKASDEIIHGVVERTEGVWRNGRVETDTVVAVTEGFKGKKYSLGPGRRAADLASAPRVRLTTIGGTPPGSPITQHAGFSPVFAQDEEVVLFLKYPEADAVKRDRALAMAPNSKIPTSPRIVGYFQGKFSVYTDEAAGVKRVVRLSLDTYGVMPSDRSMGAAIRALARNQLSVTSGPIVAKLPEDAPALSRLTSPAGSSKQAGPRLAGHALLAEQAQTAPIQASTFDDFVNLIKESVQ